MNDYSYVCISTHVQALVQAVVVTNAFVCAYDCDPSVTMIEAQAHGVYSMHRTQCFRRPRPSRWAPTSLRTFAAPQRAPAPRTRSTPSFSLNTPINSFMIHKFHQLYKILFVVIMQLCLLMVNLVQVCEPLHIFSFGADRIRAFDSSTHSFTDKFFYLLITFDYWMCNWIYFFIIMNAWIR